VIFALFCVICVHASLCPQYPMPVPLSASNPTIAKAISTVDELLTEAVKQIPGFVATIVYDQDVIWTKGYGRRNPFNPGDTSPPTQDSVVRIASITKVFTDIMLLKLRDSGIVQEDSPVTSFLPTFSVIDPYKTNHEITLKQLGSHTSGLQREIPCAWDDLSNSSRCNQDIVLSRLATRRMIAPQNTVPHYSNLGLALLGRALEKAVSIRYEDYVERFILRPLNMSMSTFDYQKVEDQMAIGTDYLPNGTPIPAQIENLGWGNPMGGLFCSSKDMSKLISLMFRTDKPADDGHQILDGNSISEMLEPTILFNDGTGGFGLPWEFNYTSNIYVKSKAGELAGYSTQLAIVPDIKLGIFHVATVSDTTDESVWTIPALNILIPAFMEALTALQPKPTLPPNWQSYTGIYLMSPPSSQYYEQIYVSNSAMYLASLVDNRLVGPHLLTVEPGAENVLRVHAPDEECRWLDDGTNLEFIYFFLER